MRGTKNFSFGKKKKKGNSKLFNHFPQKRREEKKNPSTKIQDDHKTQQLRIKHKA